VFATKRVRGEWFLLPDGAQEAVAEAQRLAALMEEAGELSAAAAKLGALESDGIVIEASDEVRSWHTQFLALATRTKECTRLDTMLNSVGVEAAAEGKDVGGLIVQEERQGKEVFDSERFKAEHPDRWEELQIRSSRMTGPFNVVGIRKLPDVASIDSSLAVFAANLEVVIGQVRSGSLDVQALNEPRLQLQAMQAAWDLDQTILDARLRVACGQADGIDGVCTWKRQLKTVEKFDLKRLKDEDPDLAVQYLSRGVPVQAVRRARNIAPQQQP
jgi:hypothetical protein